MNHKHRYLITASLALPILAPPPADAALTFTTVALTGQQAPGAAEGVTFGAIDAGVRTNAAGEIAFTARLTGTGVSAADDTAIWFGLPSAVALAAREGDPAPGTPTGVSFGELAGSFLSNNIVINISSPGHLAFNASLTGAGVTTDNHFGTWSGPAGGLGLMVQRGNPVPGLPAGVTFAALGLPTRNAAGQTQFFTNFQGTNVTSANDEALWQHGTGGLQMLVREGDPFPGAPAGHTLGSIVSLFSQNEAGNVAFAAYQLSPSITGTGVFVHTPGGAQPVIVSGQPAPGLPAGAVFAPDFHPGLIGTFPLNAANQVALRARLAGSGGVTSATNSGIWIGSPGSVQFIAREGSAAPGVSDGAVFADLHANYFRIGLNDSGTLLFHAGLTGGAVNSGNDAGIWRGTSGDLELIVREGDPVPGAPDGTVFGTLSWQPMLTRGGEALFSANLAGAGVTTANAGSIWWADASGELLQIVRGGSLFDVDDGPAEDLRTIATAAFASDVGTDNFYPQGRIPLHLTFVGGGSGIFLATVPEPSSAVLVGLLVFPALRRRRCA